MDEEGRLSDPGWPVPAEVVGENEVLLTTSRQEAEVQLGPEHAGWDITIAGGSVAVTRNVSAPGGVDMILRLQVNAAVSCPGGEVHLKSGRSVRLLEWPRVVVAHGDITVDGPDDRGYSLVLEPPDEAQLTIGGSAPVRRVEGRGLAVLTAGLASGVAGQVVSPAVSRLTVPQLRDVSVDAPDLDLVSRGPVVGATLMIGSLKAQADVEASVVQANSVRAPAIRGSIVSATAEDHLGVIVAALHKERPPERLSDKTNLIARWAPNPGPIEASIVCSNGDLLAGSCRSATLRVAGSLRTMGSAIETTLQVEADCWVDGSLTLSGADAVAVGGELAVGRTLEGDGGPEVSANVVNVRSVSSDVTLVARETVTVGGLEGGSVVAPTVTMPRGSCSESSISADVVQLAGPVVRSAILARERLETVEVDSSSTISLGGDAELPDGFGGRLTWSPASQDRTLRLAGRPAHLRLMSGAAGSPITAVVTGMEPLAAIRVDGSACVRVDKSGRSRNDREAAFCIERARVSGESRLALTGGPFAIGDLNLDAGATLAIGDSHLTGALRPGDRLIVDGPGSVRVNGVESSADAPHVTLLPSAKLDLMDGELGVVTGNADSDVVSRLSVREAAVVRRLEGDIRLGPVLGRVEGPPRSRRRGLAAPRVHALEADEESQGIVLGVDPTPSDNADLGRIGTFRVFEADARSLRAWARKERPQMYRRQSAAVKGQLIAAQVKGTAASGTARASATWAAAHTHAQIVPGFERFLRLIHRSLGYSQRPFPAALTYLLMASAWLVAGIVLDLFTREPRTLDEWLNTIVGMYLYPASFLARLPNSGADTLLDQQWLSALAFFSIGIPLVFTIVALRNFMAPPETE